jgi:hypothetical protein
MKFWPLLLLAASCLADTVTMQDGSFLKGRIERIAEGTMEFRAPSLGAANLLHLDLSLVVSFVTDEPAAGRAVTRAAHESKAIDGDLELGRNPSPPWPLLRRRPA